VGCLELIEPLPGIFNSSYTVTMKQGEFSSPSQYSTTSGYLFGSDELAFDVMA
jgi:hypothetical protein